MSALQNDTVKVIVATIAPKDDHTVLTMSTVDKVVIEFALDDMAMSILGLTLNSAIHSAKERSRNNTLTIFKRTDENE